MKPHLQVTGFLLCVPLYAFLEGCATSGIPSFTSDAVLLNGCGECQCWEESPLPQCLQYREVAPGSSARALSGMSVCPWDPVGSSLCSDLLLKGSNHYPTEAFIALGRHQDRI